MLQGRKIKDIFFGLLYVMTDNSSGPKQKSAMRSTIILFLIDWGQVLRVMTTTPYGWSSQTYAVSKHIDIVYNFTAVVSLVVPRYVFFAFAFLLVSFALGDAFYCARLFKSGEVNQIGPVKLLKMMVALVVTVLFSSVMKWLLIPVECLISAERSFSSYVRPDIAGEEACTPWLFPEIAVAIPTLVLIVMYCAFAMTATWFSLGTNPLSVAPRFTYTGSVEVKFLAMKIAITFLPFVSKYITSVGISFITWALSIMVFVSHYKTLPFHCAATNLLRGGIYATLFWLSSCSVFVAACYEGDLLPSDTIQTLQWILIGCGPLSFMAGIQLITMRKQHIQRSLDRLKGEWESHGIMSAAGSVLDSPHPDSSPLVRAVRLSSGGQRSPIRVQDDEACVEVLKSQARDRGAYEQFFDPSWERKRAFSSGHDAHTAARVLMCQRVESDLPFLAYVVARGLEEFPETMGLKMLRLSLLRFVYKNSKEAAAEEKQLRNHTIPLDLQYVMYSIDRKASQDYAAANMGKGTFNAINLIEFDSGMGRAREAHLSCLSAMRKFWSVVASSKKKKDSYNTVEFIVRHLAESDRALVRAQAEYIQLLEKFPQSVQLLQDYASFCDNVLNNSKEAEERRRQADAISGDDVGGEGPETREVDKDFDKKSTGGSSVATSNNLRDKRSAEFKTWSMHIFGPENQSLKSLDSKVKIIVLLLVLTAALAFGLTQLWLFMNVASRDAHLINATGLLRAWAVSSAYLLRTMVLAAAGGNQDKFDSVRNTIKKLAGNLQAQHFENYEIISTSTVEEFYAGRKFTVNYPEGDGWISEGSTFWTLGQDVSRRIERATSGTMEATADSDYSRSAGEAKSNLAYINENIFRSLLPVFEEIVTIYAKDMGELVGLTRAVVAGCTVANTLLVALLTAVITWGVRRTVRKISHMQMACTMAMRLPTITTKRIQKFYSEAETALKAIEDENLERKLLEEEDGTSGNHSPQSPKRLRSEVGGISDKLADHFARRNQEPVDSPPRLPIFGKTGHGGKLHSDQMVFERLHSSYEPCENVLEDSKDNNHTLPAVASPSVQLTEQNLNEHLDIHRSDSTASKKAGTQSNAESGSCNDRFDVEAEDNINKWLVSKSLVAGPDDSDSNKEQVEASVQRVSSAEVVHEDGIGHGLTEGEPERVDGLASGESDQCMEGEEVLREKLASSTGLVIARRPGSLDSVSRTSEVERDCTTGIDLEGPNVTSTTRFDEATAVEVSVAQKGSHSENSNEVESVKMFAQLLPLNEGRVSFERAESGEVENGQDEDSHSSGDPKSMQQVNLQLDGLDRTTPNSSPRHSIIKAQGTTGSKKPLRKTDSFTVNLKESLGNFAKKWQGDKPHPRHERTASDDSIPLNTIDEETRALLQASLEKYQPWVNSIKIHITVLVVLTVLSVLNTTFPARKIGDLVLLAPTINEAGRRRFLTRSCVHLSRELVLNDGYSRMTKAETASALDFYLGELKRAHDAVRLGGDLEITEGADHRNHEHNLLMYAQGCGWRENPEDCTTPEKPGAAGTGLHHLALSFFDSVKTVLHRYGPPKGEYVSDWNANPRELDDSFFQTYDNVTIDPGRVALLSSDKDMLFIQNNFAGDLFQGYHQIVLIFDRELQSIISDAIRDNEILFSVQIIILIMGFYGILFRRTIQTAEVETVTARAFVSRVPSHILSEPEISTVKHFFDANLNKID